MCWDLARPRIVAARASGVLLFCKWAKGVGSEFSYIGWCDEERYDEDDFEGV